MDTADRPDRADSDSPQQSRQRPDGARHLAERAVLADAEPAAHGMVFTTVVHGNPGSDEDMRLICEVLPAPAYRQGGNDSITYVFGPPGPATAAAFETVVRATTPPWWRIVSSLTRVNGNPLVPRLPLPPTCQARSTSMVNSPTIHPGPLPPLAPRAAAYTAFRAFTEHRGRQYTVSEPVSGGREAMSRLLRTAGHLGYVRPATCQPGSGCYAVLDVLDGDDEHVQEYCIPSPQAFRWWYRKLNLRVAHTDGDPLPEEVIPIT
ncbi:hypothetical protein ABZ897_42970 [Nonomuraea sp. NPDC046802]|uniref:hypothetical protein n=1 Tax=Nonomuraea sp. NPDC046802 TaxID=3154919 RepID=UPI0033D98888